MEVILLENMKNLGRFGSKVRVANGFGRNYLIPRGKAVPATALNLAKFESERAELEKKADGRLNQSKERAAELEAVHLKIGARAGDEGKLYGSIGTSDIVKAFAEKGVKVERHEVRLPNGPIREIGDYEIACQLHTEVTAITKVSILPEKE